MSRRRKTSLPSAMPDVFVYVGGESDAWVKTVLEGVDNPNLRVVTLMDCVELLDEETVEGMQTEKARPRGRRHGAGRARLDVAAQRGAPSARSSRIRLLRPTARTQRRMRSGVGTMWRSWSSWMRNFRM